jgi:hypothetical protein
VFTKGVSHLNGRTVRVLADGVEYNDLAVTDGTLTLPKPATKVTVGLGYAARLRLLRPPCAAPARPLRASALGRRACSRGSSIPGRSRSSTARRGNAPVRSAEQSADGHGGAALHWRNAQRGDRRRSGSDVDTYTGEIVSDDALPSIITMLVGSYELEELKG